MTRQRMVWASINDWLAVYADLTPGDEASIFAMRNVWTRSDLLRSVMETDIREVGASWAWLDEWDRPLAVVGLSWIGNVQGAAEAWSVATPALRARGNALSYTRTCRRLCESLLESGEAHRLFAYSQVGHPTSARWLKALGFTEEGTMRKFGADGSDFRMFGRVAE